MRKIFFDETQNRLYIKRTGPVSKQDFQHGIEEVQSAPFAADMEDLVMDLLEADLSSVTANEVTDLATFFSEKFSHTNFVMIVPLINFGFSRMFCTLAELEDYRIFFDIEKALEFLEIRELPI